MTEAVRFFTVQISLLAIVPVAGVLLAYAFLMIPAGIATMFTRRWGVAVAVGWGLGMLACVIGLSLSYFHDLPYGPTLILSLGAFFAAALIVRAVMTAERR